MSGESLTLSMEESGQYPWLLFRLKGQDYAICSHSIVSISTVPEDLSPVPDAPAYMKGYFFLRERVVPLYDLRTLFLLPPLAEEYQAFTDMLEERKQDHLRWVKELEDSVKEDRPFTLTTDPHKCAFGQWYDNYTSEVHSITHHLGKIDEPHKNLHRAAEEVQACTQDCEHCTREECLKTVLTRVEGEYIPLIVGLLDEAKEIFQTSFREMVIVIEQQNRLIGLMVDEVLSVETILPEAQSAVPCLGQSLAEGFTGGVAQLADGKLVLLIDQRPLFELPSHIEANQIAAT